MNKKIYSLLLVSFIIFRVFSSEMVLTPLIVYDNAGNKIDMEENPAERIYNSLEKHWFEGLLKFTYLSEQKTGIVYTLMDANIICSSEKKDYLFYGYVQKNEGNWLGNVKLYDASKKKVLKEFYSSDDIEHYDRFMDNLENNIIDGLMDITGLSNDELLKENTHPIEFNLPVAAYYWSPIDGKWNQIIMGIAGAKLGVEFYPSQKQMVFCSKLVDFSLMLKLEYNYGRNQNDAYPLSLNTIAVGLPLFLHFHYDPRNVLYMGFGMNYEIELMTYIPKYENERFLYQNVFSGEITAGYEFAVNDLIKIFSEVAFDTHFGNGAFVVVKPTMGMSINLFKESK